MPGIGHWWLILVILLVVLIVWGPGKLPDVGAGLGRAIREFRHATNEVRDSVVNATNPAPPSQPNATPAAPAATPSQSEPQSATAVPDDQRSA